jgi:phage terminase small subunit
MTILANAKHEAVAQAYIADPERIGCRAYRSVYPKSSQHTAESAWSAPMKKPEFSARIAELAEQAADGAVMTARQVPEELTRIARANMLDYMRVGPDGDPVLNFADLTRDQAAVLAEVTVEEFRDSRAAEVLEPQGHGGALKRSHGREVRRVKFKLADKIEALDLLGKHHKPLRRAPSA